MLSTILLSLLLALNGETAQISNIAAKARTEASGGSQTISSTAYCLTGTTATGTQAGYGQIAVDPSVIPLGSTVYVSDYGEAIATDTGGAIKGNIIDVWLPCDEAVQWGRRNVEITIIN